EVGVLERHPARLDFAVVGMGPDHQNPELSLRVRFCAHALCPFFPENVAAGNRPENSFPFGRNRHVKLKVYENRKSMVEATAAHAAAVLRGTLAERGAARIVAATGASQFEFLDDLTAAPGIDWSRVEMFHLDEYVGLPLDHPASFRKYLLDRLIHKAGITRYHLLDGEQDPVAVCRDAGRELTREPVDVAFVGIGENGHLAFNDPPADF